MNEIMQTDGRKNETDMINKNYEYLSYLPSAVLIQKDGKIIYANDETLKLLKCDSEWIIGKSVLSLIHSESDILVNNFAIEGDYKIKDFHSNLIDINIRCNNKQIDNSFTEFFVLSDISIYLEKHGSSEKNSCEHTKISHLQGELFESKEIYRKLINILPDGISIHDGIAYSFVSDSYAKMLGYDDPKDLIGKKLEQVISKENHDVMRQRIETLLAADKILPRVEYKFVTKQGGTIEVESTSVRFWLNNKLNILSSIRDITDRKKVEENRLLLERAIEYDKLKTEFFSNMSHELRTPLNILLSSLQLIDLYTEGRYNVDITSIRKYARIMKQNCYRLLRLINNLLDITKIDSGFYKLDMCNYNIVKVVEDITQSVAEYIKEKDIEVIFDTDIEEKILGCDADKVERIILNLLSNSIKFTKPGGRIEVNINDLTDHIKITIRDTGNGIPRDKLNSIFDRFIQVDKSLSRRSEGTGIGLALVKSLIEMHGGNISVTSEYGKFTQFDILLPVEVLSSEEESFLCNTAINSNLDDKRIERMSIEFSDIYV